MQRAQEPIRWFISDLHLSENTPKTLSKLLGWINTIAAPNNELYLLGDIFDYWVGGDHIPQCAQTLAQHLKPASQKGCSIFFMPGNRDFLIGNQYLEKISAVLLPDPYPLKFKEKIICLSHGDQLCTDDIEYQAFRQISRNPNWQKSFLSQSLEKRIETAQKLREHSKQRKVTTEKQATNLKNGLIGIMDVNTKAVQQAFLGRWPNGDKTPHCSIIIHGHTHKTAYHRQTKNHTGERWVLADWDFDNNNRGNTLKVATDGIQLINISEFNLPIDSMS